MIRAKAKADMEKLRALRNNNAINNPPNNNINMTPVVPSVINPQPPTVGTAYYNLDTNNSEHTQSTLNS